MANFHDLQRHGRRIRHLDAEIQMMQRMIQICETHTRMLIERRRSRGETEEERNELRRGNSTTWKEQYLQLANSFSHLIEYFVDVFEYEPASDRLDTLRDKFNQFFDEIRRQYPSESSDEVIPRLDQDMDDLAQLMAELKYVIEDDEGTTSGGIDAPRNRSESAGSMENEGVACKATLDSLEKVVGEFFKILTDRAETSSEQPSSTKNEGLIEFVIVDEFGRPLNEKPEPIGPEAEKNAARVVFSSDHKIVFAPQQREAPSERSVRSVSMGPRRRGKRAKSSTPVNLNNAIMLRPGAGRDRVSDARSAGEMNEDNEVNEAMLEMREMMRGVARNATVQTETYVNGEDAKSVEVSSEPGPSSTAADRQGEKWNACQREWARMLAASGGEAYLDYQSGEEELEFVDENEHRRIKRTGAGQKSRMAKEKQKQKEKEIARAGERSLLIGLMQSPPTFASASDEVKRQRSDMVCDALLGMLLGPPAGADSPTTKTVTDQ